MKYFNFNKGLQASDIKTVLGKGARYKGSLKFKEPVKINGKFEGRIDTDTLLYIEEGAVVNADINVSVLIVGGEMHGDAVVKESLILLSTGKVFGNIKANKIKINSGVTIKGKCQMFDHLMSKVDIFSTSNSELRAKAEKDE